MFLVLAQEGQQAAPQGGGWGQMLFFMVAIGLVWWFLVLGPQRKADKARRAKLDAIKKGDRVRTRGGIEGVVARVQDDSVIVKIDVEGKVHVPFSKSYVEDVLSESSAEESKDTK
jgi:preprotein translocase subunit YajC